MHSNNLALMNLQPIKEDLDCSFNLPVFVSFDNTTLKIELHLIV